MQTDYTNDMTVAAAGVLVGEDHSIRTKVNPDDVIPFGVAVAKVSGNDKGVALFTHPADVLVGVAVRTFTPTDTSYAVESALPTLNDGMIYVPVNQTVTADDDVYIQHSDTLNVQTIVFSADLVASNSIATTVNGVSLTPTVYATSNAATLTALAASIEATAGVLTAVSDGTHTITVTSVNSDPITFVGLTVTLGATHATAVVSTCTDGAAGTEGCACGR